MSKPDGEKIWQLVNEARNEVLHLQSAIENSKKMIPTIRNNILEDEKALQAALWHLELLEEHLPERYK